MYTSAVFTWETGPFSFLAIAYQTKLKTRIIMSLFCAFLSLSLLKQNQNNNNNKKPYVSVYFFSLFSSFWNFKHIKDAKVIALKAIFQVELGGERLHHSPSLGSGASSINITKSLLRSCVSLACKSAFV